MAPFTLSTDKPTGSLPTTGRIIDLCIGAAVMLGLSAALTLVDGFFGFAPIATATLGGLAATIVAGRAGVIWDRRDPAGESPKRMARGTLLGIGVAATVCLLAVLVSHLAGWGTLKLGHPGLAVLLSVVACIGGAVREEVLFRGIPMHFARKARVPRVFVTIFAALLSPTTFLLSSRATWIAVVLAIATGFLSARLVERTGSLWAAVGASSVSAIVFGPLTEGGLFDITWWSGELSRGVGAAGAPAIVAALLFVAFGLAIGRGPLKLDAQRAARKKPTRRSPRSPRR